MNTQNSCSCGRYIGISQEERIHNAFDKIFGKSEFVPMTDEEKLERQAHREMEKKARKEMEINYLTEHNQPIPKSDEEITKAYNVHKYESMTQEERGKKFKQLMDNYNVIRIMFGFPGLAYKN
jgi:hypothetical protein